MPRQTTPVLTKAQRATILGDRRAKKPAPAPICVHQRPSAVPLVTRLQPGNAKLPEAPASFPVAPGQKSLLIAALRHYAASHESLAADGFEVARHRATQARTLAHCLTMATTVNFS